MPLWAEEITVTIPPDDTPSQSAASESTDPTDHPTDSATPSDSAQAEPQQSEPVAAPAEPGPPPTAAAEAPAAPVAPPPVEKKKQKAAKKSVATPVAATAESAAPAGAEPAKPAKKKKTAKASCLNLTEDACGTNTACIWVAAGTNDAGKAVKARCRSLAILKKEEDKVRKAAAAKPNEPEVLPWATNATGAAPSSATTGSVDTKPAKKKTVSAKKSKPKPVAVEAPAAADGGDGDAMPPPDVGGAD